MAFARKFTLNHSIRQPRDQCQHHAIHHRIFIDIRVEARSRAADQRTTVPGETQLQHIFVETRRNVDWRAG